MYLEHFGLSKKPFEQLPDPDFLFLSEQHETALTSIGFAVAIQDSFVIVTGEIGSGKTTLLHLFLREHLGDAAVAYVTQTRLSDVELLQSILVEFGEQPFNKGKVELILMLRNAIEWLHQQGKQVVIVIDEAQNLSTDVLEELRLVTCASPGSKQLINVVLVGQPQFNRQIDSAELVQLRQRCRLRYHLQALTGDETSEYIRHRVSVAGGDTRELFDGDALDEVYGYTNGIPRLINMLCDTALIFACVDGASSVSAAAMEQAAEKLGLNRRSDAAPVPEIGAQDGAILRALDSRIPRDEYFLPTTPSLVGRAADCVVRVPQPTLSRYHAVIKFNGRHWTVADLRSTNGTFVNDRKVSVARLAFEDTVAFGDVKFEFCAVERDTSDDTQFENEDTGDFPATTVL